MALNRQDVDAIVSGAIPSLSDDPDVREYLLQILLSEESYEDVDALKATILPFVADDSEAMVSSVVEKLVALLGQSTEPKKGDNDSHDSKTTTKTAAKSLAAPLESTGEAPAAPKLLQAQNPNDSETNTNNPSEDIKENVGGAEHSQGANQLSKVKKDRRTKRQERLQKKHKEKKSQKKPAHSDAGQDEDPTLICDKIDATEDDATAWQERQAEGKSWGGRGFGGRGEYAGKVNTIKSNVHLSNVTVALSNGTELLQSTTMDITANHRYALVGRNGVGKSTLLNRLANRMIPGMPEMRILLVQQQVEGRDDVTPVQVLLEADIDRAQLLAEQDTLETALESGTVEDATEIEQIANRLSDVMAELDAIGADSAEQRANEILGGLQFTAEMLQSPTTNLSGGWRMRLALARALFVECDLLLLDECTNHLDLQGLDWLIQYLTKGGNRRTMIIVSHDRSFLDAVCTDVIRMDHMRLSYHVGNYSDYENQMAERAARESQILDAAERQRSRAEAFVQKQQAMANKKSADPNKQRQAKMIKEKKMERIGNYREDGKRYKNFSLKQMDESSIRLAQKVHIEADEPVIKMNFPKPVWATGIAMGDGIVRTESFSFGYQGSDQIILNDVTMELRRGSKVALVGSNGAGKSTLIKLITGDLLAEKHRASGSFWRHPNMRVGHVSQYTVEELEEYKDMTVVEYAEEKLRSGRASAEIVATASGNVRQYLGAFGLGGRHALQKIDKLSGGERMRLCFATVLADEPHLLCLDESTNHVDIETLETMSQALNEFEGTILMVSHNQAFLSGFCQELWVLENGHLSVNYSDTATFDEVFSEYRSAAVEQGNSLSNKRQTKSALAKKATKQNAGARQNTALL